MSAFQQLVNGLETLDRAFGPPPLMKGGLYRQAQSALARMGALTEDDLRGAIARRAMPPTESPHFHAGHSRMGQIASEARRLAKSLPAPRQAPPPRPSLGQQILTARAMIANARDAGEIAPSEAARADCALRQIAAQKLNEARP